MSLFSIFVNNGVYGQLQLIPIFSFSCYENPFSQRWDNEKASSVFKASSTDNQNSIISLRLKFRLSEKSSDKSKRCSCALVDNLLVILL